MLRNALFVTTPEDGLGRNDLCGLDVRHGHILHGSDLCHAREVHDHVLRNARHPREPGWWHEAMRDQRVSEVRLGCVRLSVEHGREGNGRAVTFARSQPETIQVTRH
jgi:hypothetical protein